MKTKATHTPGPWKAVAVSTPVPFKRATRDHRMEIFAGPHKIARLGGTLDDYTNAHLIAAAPDLLNALNECLDVEASRPPSIKRLDHMDMIRTAIAKATGEHK